MNTQDVSETELQIQGGGVHVIETSMNEHQEAPVDVRNVKNVKNHMRSKLRAVGQAGWSAKRGIGEYLFLLYLVVCQAEPVPVSKSMSLTLEDLKAALDQSLAPVQAEIRTVSNKFSNDLSELKISQDQQLSNLDTKLTSELHATVARVEKMEENQRRMESMRIQEPQAVGGAMGGAASQPEPQPGPSRIAGAGSQVSLAEVVRNTRPINQADVEAANNEESSKSNARRGYRYRHMDHAARMQSTPEQILKYDKDWEHGSCIVGLFPIDEHDRETAKQTITQKFSGKNVVTEEEVDLYSIKQFLEEDMGMPPAVSNELKRQLVTYFFEGKTAFLKFQDRAGVAQVYKFAGLMNKMANKNHVTRKLHIWVPPQLESRFFALKTLEWEFRQYRKKKYPKMKCHTRLFYLDGTIYAQWRDSTEKEFETIEEPANSLIPGVEFYRNTSHPRLNNMPRGAPIHKVPDKAKTPEGRKRIETTGRGRGRGRGGRGGRGGSNQGGSSQGGSQGVVAQSNRGGAIGRPGEAKRGGRGGRGRGAGTTPTSGTSAQTPASPSAAPISNLNADSEMDHQSAQDTGNSKAASFSGMESGEKSKAGTRRGRQRRAPLPQKTTLDGFFSFSPKASEKKRSRARDSDDEDQEDVEMKAPRLQTKSPTKAEAQVYAKLANIMHKSGQLGPVVAQTAVDEYQKLFDVLEKEGDYYSRQRKLFLKGKGITEKQYQMDVAAFKAQKWKSVQKFQQLDALNKLLSDTADTETKAVDYVSPDTTLDSDSSLDTSVDTSVDTNVDSDSTVISVATDDLDMTLLDAPDTTEDEEDEWVKK